MKIIHVCLVGAYNEGWTYQENMLSKFHSKQGHEVMLICIPYELADGGIRLSTDTDYVNAYGVHVIRMVPRFSLGKRIVWYVGVKEILENFKPDIIFVHGCQFMDARIIRNYGEEHPQTKIFVDNHADFSNSATNWISKNLLHKILWKHTAHVLEPVTTKFYGVLPARVDFLKKIYCLPEKKCELLVMGGDDDQILKSRSPSIRANLRKKYNILENDFLIVTGGKIDKFKKQTIQLMEAVKEINSPSIKLLVFGSVVSELKNEVDRITDGKTIQYVGWIEPDESYNYFAAADLVAFPGRHSVFWEQVAAQGIPMLCKDWPGTHHIDVGGNTVFIESEEIPAIKEKILSIVNNKQKYAEMKKIAVEEGMKMFSYDDIARRCINL